MAVDVGLTSGPGPRPPAATIPALVPLISAAELERRFAVHPAAAEQGPAHDAVRVHCLELAEELVHLVPPGRELATALTHLESAMMFAHAGIARAHR